MSEALERPAWHSDYPHFWRVFGLAVLRIRLFLWQHGARRLYWNVGKRVPFKKWWIRWADPGFMPCESCGYEWEWGAHDGWFKCERAGSYYVPGEATVHWFEGTQTCPRCRAEWPYYDSD